MICLLKRNFGVKGEINSQIVHLWQNCGPASLFSISSSCVMSNGLLQYVMGLCGKVLVAGGAIGVASVRSCEKLPPCLIAPVPATSKTDWLLPKAKPISDGGSASVITYLRRGK